METKSPEFAKFYNELTQEQIDFIANKSTWRPRYVLINAAWNKSKELETDQNGGERVMRILSPEESQMFGSLSLGKEHVATDMIIADILSISKK